jgi:hypothetical protein
VWAEEGFHFWYFNTNLVVLKSGWCANGLGVFCEFLCLGFSFFLKNVDPAKSHYDSTYFWFALRTYDVAYPPPPSTAVTSYLNGPFVEIFKLAYHGFVFCLPATVFLVEFVYIYDFS